MKNEFYITIPSNVSQFVENNTANFKVRLPQKIALDGEWETALVEIMYPHSWNNIDGQKDQIFLENTAKMYPNSFFFWIHDILFVHCLIEPNYYSTIPELLTAMKCGVIDGWNHSKAKLIDDANRRATAYEDEIKKLYNKIAEYDAELKETLLEIEQGIADAKGKAKEHLQKTRTGKIRALQKHYQDKTIEVNTQINVRNDQLAEWRSQIQSIEKDSYVTDSVTFLHDSTHHRCVIKLKNTIVTEMRLSPALSYMLGYGNGTQHISFTKIENKASYPPDLGGGFYALYVYCSLVENQIVGQYRVPLLRTVHVQGNHGEICEKMFHSPHYVPIAVKEFDTIEIDIKNDKNESVPFNFGKIIVKMHFRKRRSFVL